MLGHQPEGGPIMPLKLVREMCETPENVDRNLSLTLSKPYVRFNEYLNSQRGSVSIVGSGPSLARTYTELVGDVIACNGAHDFLIERGVVPKFQMMFDAAEVMADFITPHPDVTYLIASRCHQAVFEKLAGHKVIVWHAKGDLNLDDILADREVMEPMVHGGSAAVTRAMFLAYAMGWRQTHLFGADSSCEGEVTHVRKSLVHESLMDVWAARKWFKTTAWMAGQVEDFKLIAPELKNIGLDIIVHGSGLLPAIAHEMGITVISNHFEETNACI